MNNKDRRIIDSYLSEKYIPGYTKHIEEGRVGTLVSKTDGKFNDGIDKAISRKLFELGIMTKNENKIGLKLSYFSCPNKKDVESIAMGAIILADYEKLKGHADSIRIRFLDDAYGWYNKNNREIKSNHKLSMHEVLNGTCKTLSAFYSLQEKYFRSIRVKMADNKRLFNKIIQSNEMIDIRSLA